MAFANTKLFFQKNGFLLFCITNWSWSDTVYSYSEGCWESLRVQARLQDKKESFLIGSGLDFQDFSSFFWNTMLHLLSALHGNFIWSSLGYYVDLGKCYILISCTRHSGHSWRCSLLDFLFVFTDDLNDVLSKTFASGEQARCTHSGHFRKVAAEPWAQCLCDSSCLNYFIRHIQHYISMTCTWLHPRKVKSMQNLTKLLDKRQFPTWNIYWI